MTISLGFFAVFTYPMMRETEPTPKGIVMENTESKIIWPKFIESEQAKTRRLNRAHTWVLVKKTVKWTLIGVGVATVVSAIANYNNQPEDEQTV